MTPRYQVLPDLAADDFARLKASIIERGVEVPVMVDEDGEILDGHNRAMIADSLGIEYPKTVLAGLAPHEKRLLAVELNLARRQLTDAQKVMLGRQIEPDVAEQSRRREVAGKASDPMDNCPQGTTRDEVARTVGLGSGRTYERAKQVIEAVEREAPDLLPHVESGDLTIQDIKTELKDRGLMPKRPDPFAQDRAEIAALVETMPQESRDFLAETARDEQPHAVREQVLTFLLRLRSGRQELSKVPPELLQRYAANDPQVRESLEKATDLLTGMVGTCRTALGADKGAIRRIV